MADTNYGFQLKRGNNDGPPETFTALGEVVNITPPGIAHVKAESTHHGSGGKRSFIGTGLAGIKSFTASINYDADGVTDATLISDVNDGNVRTWQVIYPDSTIWQFEALVEAFDPQAANAQSPGVLSAQITFQPSGDETIT